MTPTMSSISFGSFRCANDLQTAHVGASGLRSSWAILPETRPCDGPLLEHALRLLASFISCTMAVMPRIFPGHPSQVKSERDIDRSSILGLANGLEVVIVSPAPQRNRPHARAPFGRSWR